MTATAENVCIRWEEDDDRVVTLVLDAPNQAANTMSAAFVESLVSTVDRLEAVREEIAGVVISSAKKTFFAGGDLNEMIESRPEDAPAIHANLTRIKAQLRRLETLGVPVVAAINGAALGGGYELALACHRRIAADVRGCVVGLPEVTLGLLPGGGGVVRTVRLMGVKPALEHLLLEGQRHRPAAALALGLIDEVVDSPDELLDAAKAWISTEPEPVQPWDVKGYKVPGGTMLDSEFAASMAPYTAQLRLRLGGANLPAPSAILAAAVEGAHLTLDQALIVESRYFVELVTGPVAKNMMRTFFDMQAVKSGASRPSGYDRFTATKLGVVGAGMMGAGIAYQAARQGIDVMLGDVSLEQADRGKSYAIGKVAKEVERGRLSREKADELVGRISTTSELSEFAGCDVVIEAVFEDPQLKRRIFAELEAALDDDALLCSNTSTLPITELGAELRRPENFIGTHFFSPVDRMPLLEIVVGPETSDATLARTIDVGTQLGKTTIVVNDSRGFFTSRVIGKYLDEALAMLGEGCAATSIEQAARQAGYPVPPLQLLDETTLTLPRKVRRETRAATEAAGQTWTEHPAEAVMNRLIDELGRTGRVDGAGFYDYEDGRRTTLWPGLAEHFPPTGEPVPFEDMKERLLFAEALEAVRCLDEGVLRSTADANVGSLLGIGYPSWTGGVIQYIDGYPGGAGRFVERAQELAARYGERFAPPASLVDAARSGRRASSSLAG